MRPAPISRLFRQTTCFSKPPWLFDETGYGGEPFASLQIGEDERPLARACSLASRSMISSEAPT